MRRNIVLNVKINSDEKTTFFVPLSARFDPADGILCNSLRMLISVSEKKQRKDFYLRQNV
jgi:hypothetical protein